MWGDDGRRWRTLFDRDVESAREQVAKLPGLAQEALDELRSLVFELRPADLERDGLCGALRKHVDLVRRLGQNDVELDLPDGIEPDEQRDRELLRIAQEALQNALKHARAGRVIVRLRTDGPILLEVEDDGVGFDPNAAAARSRRLGLTSMEERARHAGGRLEIRSAAGAGTTVSVRIGG